MKFIINSQIFFKQLQSMSGVITNSNTVPIINCFRFHLEDSELTVTATDLETTIVSKIELEAGRAEGISDVAVPSKLLLDILKSLDDVPLNFSVDPATYGIEISSGDGKYRLAGQSAETFPTMPKFEHTVRTVLPAEALIESINKTAFAASTDKVRQQMAGIFFQLGPEYMTVVATDAHKLVRYRRKDVKCDEPASFIMPSHPVTLVKNILAGKGENCDVIMEYNTSNVSFSFDNNFIFCRLVEGKYPNIEAAIPKENPNKLTVDRNSILNTLRRVRLFASQSTQQVRLSLSEREMTISAEDIEFSNDAHEKIPCQYEGDPMEIGFNAKFLTEMVNNIDTENILIEMSHPSRAGILFPIYDTDEERVDEILMLVMPVMLAN